MNLAFYDNNVVAFRGGAKVRLRPAECKLLVTLANLEGDVMTKQMAKAALYSGRSSPPDVKILDIFICKLRETLKPSGHDKWIKTAWGRGYFLHEGKETYKLQRMTIDRKISVLDQTYGQDKDTAELNKTMINQRISFEELVEWRTSYADRGPAGLLVTKQVNFE